MCRFAFGLREPRQSWRQPPRRPVRLQACSQAHYPGHCERGAASACLCLLTLGARLWLRLTVAAVGHVPCRKRLPRCAHSSGLRVHAAGARAGRLPVPPLGYLLRSLASVLFSSAQALRAQRQHQSAASKRAMIFRLLDVVRVARSASACANVLRVQMTMNSTCQCTASSEVAVEPLRTRTTGNDQQHALWPRTGRHIACTGSKHRPSARGDCVHACTGHVSCLWPAALREPFRIQATRRNVLEHTGTF